MTAKTAARCDDFCVGVQCSRPLGHKGTHWSKELASNADLGIAAKSSAAPATPQRCVFVGCTTQGIPQEGFDFFACEPCLTQLEIRILSKLCAVCGRSEAECDCHPYSFTPMEPPVNRETVEQLVYRISAQYKTSQALYEALSTERGLRGS